MYNSIKACNLPCTKSVRYFFIYITFAKIGKDQRKR